MALSNEILDAGFIIFHTVFILFNMTGWIFQKTRWLHFTTMSLTAFSWVVLGLFYGFGYCFLTDWHWEIRREMGEPIQFYSYIQFLMHEMTGFAPDRQLTDIVTAAVAIFCYTACIVLLIRDQRTAQR